jgi:S-adenosylmethionine-diacylglycerol 3-amino-3-carboxypropyl transferase
VLARDNPFLSLILRGYVEPSAFPPYLTTAGVEVIRSRLDRLSWHHANVIDFLEKAAPNSIDCFSLSDIASYMDSSNFLRLLAAVRGAARPGARFSIRQFMSERRIPDALRESFLRDYNLERHLEEQDYCFVYRFMAGTISK